MRLTYEEFRLLPMQYLQGMTFDWGAIRMLHNEQFNIYKETNTKRVRIGDVYSGWRKPEVCFYIGNGPIYSTARELYEAEFLTPWFTDQRPVRDGWYETDRGSLYFQTHVGQWFRDTADIFPVLSPKKWRGMADVATKPNPTESNP
jgi:hypothetical protein